MTSTQILHHDDVHFTPSAENYNPSDEPAATPDVDSAKRNLNGIFAQMEKPAHESPVQDDDTEVCAATDFIEEMYANFDEVAVADQYDVDYLKEEGTFQVLGPFVTAELVQNMLGATFLSGDDALKSKVAEESVKFFEASFKLRALAAEIDSRKPVPPAAKRAKIESAPTTPK